MAKHPSFVRVLKFNPYHNKLGLFTSPEGGGGSGGDSAFDITQIFGLGGKRYLAKWAAAHPDRVASALKQIRESKVADVRPYDVKPRWEDHPAGWRKFEDWQRRSLARTHAERFLKKVLGGG